MESRYFPEVNEEEEEPEDEGEGSPTWWWARPRPPGGVSKNMQPPRHFLGSAGLHLCPGVLPIPWEEALSLGGRIRGRLCCSRKAPHKLRVQTHGILEAAAWTMGRTVRVSYVHSPLYYHRRLVLPPDEVTAPHLGTPFLVICLGCPSAALMLL